MKVKLEFDIDDGDTYENRKDAIRSIIADEAFSNLLWIKNRVREYFKYAERSQEEAEKALQEISTTINESNLLEFY